MAERPVSRLWMLASYAILAAVAALRPRTKSTALNPSLYPASPIRMIAPIIGIVMLLFAAIGVVVQLKDAFNTIWEVKAPASSGIWEFARAYGLSLAGVLALGFLLLVSMLLTTVLAGAGKYLASVIS